MKFDVMYTLRAYIYIYLYQFELIDFIHVKSGIKITQPANRETASFHAIEIIVL